MPSSSYRSDAPRRPVNLSLDSDLLRIGKGLGINISALAEKALAAEVRRRLEEAWLRESAEAIQSYNERVEAGGVFSDGLRSF